MRRERRRKIDADQDPRRRLSARWRNHPARWAGGRIFAPDRRAPRRDQHHPSGAEPVAAALGGGEHLSRRRADPFRHPRPADHARRGRPPVAAARLVDRPDSLAGDLSIAHQQIVEIAKALAIDARILVMDEPTAALDRVDAGRLLDLVRKVSAEGVTIVYISHRMVGDSGGRRPRHGARRTGARS